MRADGTVKGAFRKRMLRSAVEVFAPLLSPHTLSVSAYSKDSNTFRKRMLWSAAETFALLLNPHKLLA